MPGLLTGALGLDLLTGAPATPRRCRSRGGRSPGRPRRCWSRSSSAVVVESRGATAGPARRGAAGGRAMTTTGGRTWTRADGRGGRPDEPGDARGAGARSARRRSGEHALIVCDSLVRIYQSEGIEVQALQGLDLLVEDGRARRRRRRVRLRQVDAALGAVRARRAHRGPRARRTVGPHVDDRAAQRVEYRRSMVGFVWQQTARNLVPYLTAAENVALPMALAGARRKAAERRRRRAARRPRRRLLRRPPPGADVRR